MTEHVFSMDADTPPEMARRVETVGVAKAKLDAATMSALAVLAGAFIALGANVATVAFTENGLGCGMSRLLRNWAIVYLGNFVGALGTVAGVYLSRQGTFDAYHVDAAALNIAHVKVHYAFLSAFALGALCNALVGLAVWLCFSARTTTDKIVTIVPPITAFVAAGFEHSVANMYFIPMGLLLRDHPRVIEVAGHSLAPLAELTWRGFFVSNLLPVTLGNVLGGAIMVAAVYCVFAMFPKRLPKSSRVNTGARLDGSTHPGSVR
jgi:formate transporter